MELADLPFGKSTLVFRHATGTVLDTAKRSETHVSGSGGGGMSFHGGQGGRTDPVTISSSTTTRHDIWIKDEETGKDRPIQLSGVDMPLRTGQRITMISVGEERDGKEPEGWWYATVVNHDAGRCWDVAKGEVFVNRRGFGGVARLYRWWFFALVPLVIGGCSIVIASTDSIAVAFLAVAVLGVSFARLRKLPDGDLIDRHLAELGQTVLEQGETGPAGR